MTSIEGVELTAQDLDRIAWEFLGSEFTGQVYADWPIDRRIQAYLVHHGDIDVANDGSVCDALTERVMANIGRALREGLLTGN